MGNTEPFDGIIVMAESTITRSILYVTPDRRVMEFKLSANVTFYGMMEHLEREGNLILGHTIDGEFNVCWDNNARAWCGA